MNILQEVQKQSMKVQVPVIRAGHTVRVHQRIKEGEKERTQIFEGLVIKVNSGHGADKSFTVRKIVEGIGVEKVFALYSPRIEKIEVKKTAKVRRSKLYYMRDRSGKSARLKENFVQNAEMEDAIVELADQKEAEEAANAENAEQPQTAPEATPEVTAEAPAAEEPKAEAVVEEKAEAAPKEEEDKKE